MMKYLCFLLFLLTTSAHASSYQWYCGTGPGSRYYWEHGKEAGSRYFWENGTGPGSEYYWDKGDGPGSKYFWTNGMGPGSQYYIQRGDGRGSIYYWLYGSGLGSQYKWQRSTNNSIPAIFLPLCLQQLYVTSECMGVQEIQARRLPYDCSIGLGRGLHEFMNSLLPVNDACHDHFSGTSGQ